MGDDATAVDEVEAPVSAVSDGFEEDADAPSPLEEPPPPATLIDSVIADQIHQGHLRISVVVIIAGLMGICGFGACVLFVTVRATIQLFDTGFCMPTQLHHATCFPTCLY